MTTIPFGKYKDQTVTDIARVDPGYLTWLSAQPDFARKNPKVMEAIQALNGGSDTTPVHNRIQAAFLNDDFRMSVVRAVLERNPDHRHLPRNEDFYDVAGFEKFCDVSLGSRSMSGYCYVAVEIKPTIGDDYPVIMRQMAGQAAMAKKAAKYGHPWYEHILYTRDNVSGIADSVLTAMFDKNGIQVIIDRDTPLPV